MFNFMEFCNYKKFNLGFYLNLNFIFINSFANFKNAWKSFSIKV